MAVPIFNSTRRGNPLPDPHSGEPRIYGGDTGLIHSPDGTRGTTGEEMARILDSHMRAIATRESYLRGELNATRNAQLDNLSLCPGCYMTVLYNMARTLALRNGQDLRELGATLSAEFDRLARGEQGEIEHVQVAP